MSMSTTEQPTWEHETAPQLVVRVRGHLAQGELDEAGRCLDFAAARWPGNVAFADERIALRLAQGRTEEAIAIGREILRRCPDRARTAGMLVDALARAGEPAAAIAAASSPCLVPWSPALLQRVIHCRRALGEDAGALADVERWLGAQADSAALRGLVNRLPEATADDKRFALAVAELGGRHWPADAAMASRAARSAMAMAAWPEAQYWLERHSRLRPDDLRHLAFLANIAFFESGDLLLAVRATEQALGVDPHLVAMRLLAAHAHFLLGDTAKALAHASAGLDDAAADEEQRWMFASLVRACDERPQAEARVRDALDVDAGEPPFVLVRHGVQAWIPAGATRVVLYFGSVNYSWSLGFNALRAMLPAGTGLVFLQDFSRLFFLGGIASLGADVEETIAALRAMLPASVGELLGLGFSGGGYSALLYGLELGVTRYLLFSAPTDGGEEAMRHPESMAPRYQRIRSVSTRHLVNLHDRVAARPDRPRIDLWFGADSPWDRCNAERMADLANVHLHPIQNCNTHDLLGFMQADGSLEPVLREWLERDH